jgi:hypothetical protein
MPKPKPTDTAQNVEQSGALDQQQTEVDSTSGTQNVPEPAKSEEKPAAPARDPRQHDRHTEA